MGGATHQPSFLSRSGGGLSPRGRGNRTQQASSFSLVRSIPAWAGQPIKPVVRVIASGSIPAWAGQPKPRTQLLMIGRVYPRVGGATANLAAVSIDAYGLSPPGRGNPDRA